MLVRPGRCWLRDGDRDGAVSVDCLHAFLVRSQAGGRCESEQDPGDMPRGSVLDESTAEQNPVSVSVLVSVIGYNQAQRS